MTSHARSRTQTVMEAVRRKILSGALGVDERLPSIRHMAENMGVSPSTVAEAYDRLAAEGAIRARRGAGFFVADGAARPLALSERVETASRDVDPFWVSRQALASDPSTLKPGCGWLPADWMPNDAFRKALRGLGRSSDAMLADYGAVRGPLGLRRVLLGRFAEEGLAASLDQVLLAGSGTQALDLVCRLLLKPGDRVLVDDPCYFNFRALFRALNVEVAGVPYTPSGPDITAMECAMATHKPRLYLTNSALHNPTGATMSPATAHRVLTLAAAHSVTVVEDDIFADLEPAHSPRLAVLDGLEHVVRIGSFSKTLSASLRCGYIAARPEMIEALVDLQIATSFCGYHPLAAEAITAVLTGGSYRKHMELTRTRLMRLREEVAEKLSALDVTPWLLPRGGFYLWCRLPEGQDAARIARSAMEANILLAPGNIFSVHQTATRFLRFNVAHMADQRIYDVLKRLLSA
ncbi:PLP-dependent aminotransferase family protein [Allorhizobium undicola]|uniref:aminotransferase-like domain-containing protein n=1 Tax=Allorhizobium undicola TaxID=78527 RepID=UPI003D358324